MRYPFHWLAFAFLLGCDQPSMEAPPVVPNVQETLSLTCFGFHSTVVFSALPESPQRLEAIYQGPDQAHWWFGTLEDSNTGRRLRYRSGDSIYAIEPGTGESIEYVSRERAAAMLQFELRRAWMLWPDGFEWRDTDRGREFELGDGSGRLFVELEAGQPVRFYSRDSDGVELESLSDLTWQEFRQRRFPKEATLSVGGTVVWTETLERIIPDCEYVSFFFLPPDRRSAAVTAASQTGNLRHVDLPVRFSQRTSIRGQLSWSDLRERGNARLKEMRAQLPEFEERLAFAIELDEDAKPQAILLLLDADQAEVPEDKLAGWKPHDSAPALGVLLSGLEKLTPGMLAGLRTHLPSGTHAGTTYLRLPPQTEPDLPLQLVVTVEAE